MDENTKTTDVESSVRDELMISLQEYFIKSLPLIDIEEDDDDGQQICDIRFPIDHEDSIEIRLWKKPSAEKTDDYTGIRVHYFRRTYETMDVKYLYHGDMPSVEFILDLIVFRKRIGIK